MLLWMNPVTDRKKSDVDRVLLLKSKGWQNMTQEEKNEFLSDMKGALNYSDIERILNNIQLLASVLEISVSVPSIPSIPDTNFFDRILQLVGAIQSAYPAYTTTPSLPAQPLNHFSKWNDVEKILSDIYTILNNNFYYYCGSQVFSGEDIGLLL